MSLFRVPGLGCTGLEGGFWERVRGFRVEGGERGRGLESLGLKGERERGRRGEEERHISRPQLEDRGFLAQESQI